VTLTDELLSPDHRKPVDPKAVYRTRRVGLFEEAADKIEGLTADLRNAVEVAYRRGATDWTRLNYPTWFQQFEAAAAVERTGLVAIEGDEP